MIKVSLLIYTFWSKPLVEWPSKNKRVFTVCCSVCFHTLQGHIGGWGLIPHSPVTPVLFKKTSVVVSSSNYTNNLILCTEPSFHEGKFASCLVWFMCLHIYRNPYGAGWGLQRPRGAADAVAVIAMVGGQAGRAGRQGRGHGQRAAWRGWLRHALLGAVIVAVAVL